MNKLKSLLGKEKEFKLYKIILYILVILFTSIFIKSILKNNFLNSSIAVAGIIIVFTLNWASHKYNKYFIDVFISIMNIFLFISMYLGSIKGFYGTYEWWDVVAHTLSGIIFSLLGFILLFRFDKDLNLNDNGKLFLAVLFSMSLGIVSGVFWEIYEFSMGIFFNLNMQSGGLLDTMKDLISDTVGAIFASITFGIYIKIKLDKKDYSKA